MVILYGIYRFFARALFKSKKDKIHVTDEDKKC